jgi:hypothetical protein
VEAADLEGLEEGWGAMVWVVGEGAHGVWMCCCVGGV